MEEAEKIFTVLSAICVSGLIGFSIGQVYGSWRERQAVLKYHQNKPMSLLEEAINYLYLTIRKP